MSKYNFDKNTYKTNPNLPRVFIDTLFFKTRVGYYFKYLPVIFAARNKALKGVYHKQEWIDSSQDIMQLIEQFGGRFDIQGFDNLRNNDKPVVIVSNHMSTLETMVFPGLIAPFMDVTFVVKDSLVKGNFFGPVMRSRHPIVVGRTNSMADFKTVMEKGEKLLSEGTSIIIFPQSRRTTEFITDEFNSLGVKLAKKAGVDVIPAAIKTDFWENGKMVKELGPINRDRTIYMDFGPKMQLINGKKEHKEIVDFIKERLIKWGGIIK